MKSILLVVLLYLIRTTISFTTVPDGFKVQTLHFGEEYSCCRLEPYVSRRDLPVLYCFQGLSQGILKTWISISVETDLNPDFYELYEGYNTKEVWTKFITHRSSWAIGWMNWQSKKIHLNPFKSSCFGILTEKDYVLKLEVSDANGYFLALFILGVLLFYYAQVLSENKLFYYVTVMILGMTASILILLYFMLKIMPLKKPAMLGFVAGGAVITTYLVQIICGNIYAIVFTYQKYVVGYLSVSALLSFMLYYRFGPITDPRSKKIIKFSLQVAASAMIYNSSYFRDAVQVIVILLFIYTNISIPRWLFKPFLKVWNISFPRIRMNLSRQPVTPRRLLTKIEYEQEGVEETERALSELRKYCLSPNFANKWQIAMGLKNQRRFCKFLEGESHFSVQEDELQNEAPEVVEPDSLLTDDSDEDN